MRAKLAGMDLRREGYFIETKDIDFGMYPTLFDYLIMSWTDYLLGVEAYQSTGKAVKPKAAPLLVEEFTRPFNPYQRSPEYLFKHFPFIGESSIRNDYVTRSFLSQITQYFQMITRFYSPAYLCPYKL